MVRIKKLGPIELFGEHGYLFGTVEINFRREKTYCCLYMIDIFLGAFKLDHTHHSRCVLPSTFT